MRPVFTLSLLFLFYGMYLCKDVNKLFEKINEQYLQYNQIAAKIAWESSIDPGSPELPNRAANFQRRQIEWQHRTCDRLASLNHGNLLNSTQRRQTYLLCRGPKFTYEEAREGSNLNEELHSIYTDAVICIPTNKISTNTLTGQESAILDYIATVKSALNLKRNASFSIAAKIAVMDDRLRKSNNTLCLKGEEDLEKLMKFSRKEEVLKFLWLVWREKVGPPMKEPYRKLVELENIAARRNGYTDIGASWRDELEIPALKQLCRELYSEIQPLYTLLHGVARYYLRKHYGDVVSRKGPIPAHLLGGLWAQNWEPLADLIIPRTFDIDDRIKHLNWTVLHMVKRAEDFYQSLGLPAMTETFWRESVFTRDGNKNLRCHGTAADMFRAGDFRLLYCSGTTADDFYVLHHEMGHIQYYMAYENQPALFRQANSALHETIGDTIMFGVLTPQHLHRLGLVNDSILYIKPDRTHFEPYNNAADAIIERHDEQPKLNDNHVEMEHETNGEVTADEILMLKLALNKLPQIPFSLLIDEFRWKYFEGGLDSGSLNEEFWRMALRLQGVVPPEYRGEEYFDAGSKFHVPDNTPYIRYFLSSFLQHQLLESLCKAAVFGRRHVQEDLPDTITMNRCDIYGSKAVGKLLKDLMSRGHSQSWREILQTTTGSDEISSSALMRYYRPLYKLLLKLVRTHRIPVGW